MQRRRLHTGSILLIVVVLLLLLAILGSAYLSTTRGDRLTSMGYLNTMTDDQNAVGLANAAGSIIQDDLNDCDAGTNGGLAPFVRGASAPFPAFSASASTARTFYRGTFNWGSTGTYYLHDIVAYGSNPTRFFMCDAAGGTSGSTAPTTSGSNWWNTTHVPNVTSSSIQYWLASRVPEIVSTANGPYWPNVSQYVAFVPTGTNIYQSESILQTAFESPDIGTNITTSLTTPITIVYPTYKNVGNMSVPALMTTVGGTKYVAGDADGDGVPDCFLSRIPGDNFDGLTWYVGFRIIDNNSAINANTAWISSQDYDFSGNTLPNWGFFASNVDITGLLDAPDAAASLNNYRFNFSTPVVTPLDESGIVPPFVDHGGSSVPTARSDYQYISQGDAIQHQFTDRLDNPGFVTNSARYATLPTGDSSALAYHFCLVNPLTATAHGASSLIEQLLPTTLYQPTTSTYYRSAPYYYSSSSTTPDGNNIPQWFSDHFDYGNLYGSQTRDARSLMTTRNPVSNYINPVYAVDSNYMSTGGDPINYSSSAAFGVMTPYSWNQTNTTVFGVHYRGPWANLASTTTFNFDDIVLFAPGNYAAGNALKNGQPTLTAPGYTFLCTVQGTTAANPPATVTGGVITCNAGWRLQPWQAQPTKVNVNTGTFSDLFRAYWSVMAGNWSYADTTGSAACADVTAYRGGRMVGIGYGAANTPYTYTLPATNNNAQGCFRSPLRDPTSSSPTNSNTFLPPLDAMQLRAALAAVNTLGLRDGSENVYSRIVPLVAYVKGVYTTVYATVYSSAPQPFISEVYVDNDTSNGGKGYVAVELYNPYSVPLTLVNWQLACINRASTGTYPSLTFNNNAGANPIGAMYPMNDAYTHAAPIATTGRSSTIQIPPYGYALLENYNPPGSGLTGVTADPTDVTVGRAPSSLMTTTGVWYGAGGLTATNANTTDVYVPGLANVMATAAGSTTTGGELVILRPRRADGQFCVSTDPQNTYKENTGTTNMTTTYPSGSWNLYDMVPIDSFDFTSSLLVQGVTPPYAASYLRRKGANELFKATFPGFYGLPAVATYLREGYLASGPSGTPLQTVPATFAPNPQFGAATATNVTSSYTNNFPPIQVYNLGNVTPTAATVLAEHFPNSLYGCQTNSTTGVFSEVANAAPYAFPFGGFARNGDILDVPFIGAYRISTNNEASATVSNFIELNSLPRDCGMAAVSDGNALASTSDVFENVGRFVPLASRSSWGAAFFDYYWWTAQLFNYLTVQSPGSSYMPNYDPAPAEDLPVGSAAAMRYTPSNTGTPPTPIHPVDAAAMDQVNQDNCGVEGLININTAPWPVLAALPMVPGNTAANQTLAKAIVAYREANGPFISIFDLNKVTGFETGNGAFTLGSNTTTPPTVNTMTSTNAAFMSPPDPSFPKASGITNGGSGGTALAEDYQSDNAMVTRISNLVTTHSDTYTVYVVLEGWQNAVIPVTTGNPVIGTGAQAPQLKTVRRYAFIVDRSAISPAVNARSLRTIMFPND